MKPDVPPRILLVDDHPMMRAGVRQLLLRDFPTAEIGEAGSARETLGAVHNGHWDIVLLDLDLPDRSGLDLLKDLKLADPRLPVLVVSGLAEQELGLQVLRQGAAGFCSKTAAADQLAAAVRKVLAGGRHVSTALAEKLADSLGAGVDAVPHEQLSSREMQILLSIAGGRSVGEIATQLSLSVKTVSTYRTRLLTKMGMRTNADLMRYGMQHRLVR
ncbi:MAG: response regulator transcription factor [Opitutaceae bacterium]|nr:response regulator transcription factor [Opitutaceae bacterium]